MEKFFDDFGLLHVEPNVPSENGIYFLAHFLRVGGYSRKGLKPITYSWYKKDFKFWYQANPPEQGDHFSHDNMLGLYYCCLNVIGTVPEFLPIFKWNGRRWWHPRDWLVFSIAKGKLPSWFAIFFIPLVWFSFRKPKEDTSGKLLWILRADMFGRFFGFWTLKHYVDSKVRDQYGCEYELLSIYFRRPDHPIRVLTRDKPIYTESE